ncbi:MAG: PTS sugar transporter subunit IIC [Fusobacterium ulcerans]|uniref:PTS sugar transporter subunit IIC n=1 Tax=Fusobacterium ulcerans TaxID=861 RepID=UPI003A88B346
MEMIKGIALLLVVLAGFSLFSLKMPKGMKAMGALAGAATASFLVEAFQLYVGGDLLGFEFLKGVGQAAGSMGGVAAGALVPIALGVNPTYAILIGVSVAGYGILPGFLAGYILSFVVPKLEQKIPQGVDLIVIICLIAPLARFIATVSNPVVNSTLLNIGGILESASHSNPILMGIVLGGIITVVATAHSLSASFLFISNMWNNNCSSYSTSFINGTYSYVRFNWNSNGYWSSCSNGIIIYEWSFLPQNGIWR